MAERINNAGVIVLASVVFGINQGLTADWSSILKKAISKYAKYEEEVKDMTIMYETEVVTPERKMTLENRVLKKGKKGEDRDPNPDA